MNTLYCLLYYLLYCHLPRSHLPAPDAADGTDATATSDADADDAGAQFEIANADSRKAPSQEFHH